MAFGTAFCRECLGLKCIKGNQEVVVWIVRGPIFVALFPLLLGAGVEHSWNQSGQVPG